jgi:hypothetical protein
MKNGKLLQRNEDVKTQIEILESKYVITRFKEKPQGTGSGDKRKE